MRRPGVPLVPADQTDRHRLLSWAGPWPTAGPRSQETVRSAAWLSNPRHFSRRRAESRAWRYEAALLGQPRLDRPNTDRRDRGNDPRPTRTTASASGFRAGLDE